MGLRIGIEGQRLLRKNKHGMEVVTLELIKHLQQIDHENEYFVFVKEDEDRHCINETENFKVIVSESYKYPYWEQVYLPKIAKEFKLDLLHCTSNTAPVVCKIPLILTLHDIIYLEKVDFNGSTYQNFGNLYRRWVVPKVVHQCKAVITVSEFEKRRIQSRFNLSEEKLKVVYNAVSSQFSSIMVFEDTNRQIEKRLPKDYMLFLGNTAPKKNTEGLLKAYCHYVKNTVSPLSLVITDCTREYIEGKLSPLADHILLHKVMDKIVVLDHVPYEQLAVVYQQASLFLYPSLRESFGLPILEAMACGTPVITSNTSSMPEVAGGAAILVNPESAEEISHAMSGIQSNTSLREKLISGGLKRAMDFSWQQTAQHVRKIYESSVLIKAKKKA